MEASDRPAIRTLPNSTCASNLLASKSYGLVSRKILNSRISPDFTLSLRLGQQDQYT
jgi:hypothetical protein